LKEGSWWYRFRFAGRMIDESAKTQSKTVAREAERQRRRQLEETFNRIERRELPPAFAKASEKWLTLKSVTVSPRTVRIQRANLVHLLPNFGKLLMTEITALRIARYQQARLS
jgi:hypothetical protein